MSKNLTNKKYNTVLQNVNTVILTLKYVIRLPKMKSASVLPTIDFSLGRRIF